MFHRNKSSVPKKTDKAYVSEFENFHNRFLEEHPEAVREQRTGWSIYWDKKVDLQAIDRAERDKVPDDRYGFDYSAWRQGLASDAGKED